MISICSFLSYSNTSFARTIRESNDNFILYFYLLLLRHMYHVCISKKNKKNFTHTSHSKCVKKKIIYLLWYLKKTLTSLSLQYLSIYISLLLFSPCSPTALLISLRFFIFIYWLLAFGFWYFYTLHPRTRARIIFIKERQI